MCGGGWTMFVDYYTVHGKVRSQGLNPKNIPSFIFLPSFCPFMQYSWADLCTTYSVFAVIQISLVFSVWCRPNFLASSDQLSGCYKVSFILMDNCFFIAFIIILHGYQVWAQKSFLYYFTESDIS